MEILASFSNPSEGEMITDVHTHSLLRNSFTIQPNTSLGFNYTDVKGVEKFEQWEAFTDALNYNYLFCAETESTAYYFNNGSIFYFTAFYGDKNSLLYYFYLTAYKVLLGYYENVEVRDELPLTSIFNKNGIMWLYDFVAPFANRIHALFTISPTATDDAGNPATLTLASKIDLTVYGRIHQESKGSITLKNNRIEEFTYQNRKIKIEAKCADTL
jgi:hypothetical protein